MAGRAHKTTIETAFGAVLADLRNAREISQEALGHEAGSGRTYISQLERGERGPTLKTVFRLADALDLDPVEIVRRVRDRLR